MRKITLATLILAAVGFVAAAPDPTGKATWDKNCVKCHGADGKGNAKIATTLKLEPVLRHDQGVHRGQVRCGFDENHRRRQEQDAQATRRTTSCPPPR